MQPPAQTVPLVPPPIGVDEATWRAAIHEAGHLVADDALGLVPLKASLGKTAGSGSVTCRDLKPHDAIAEAHIVSCLAGYSAEALLCGADPSSEEGALKDRALADATLQTFRPSALRSAFEDKANILIREYSCTVVNLAKELISVRRPMLGEELLLVIEVAKEIPAAASRLALFRTAGKTTLATIQPPQLDLPAALVRGDFAGPGCDLIDRLNAGDPSEVDAYSDEDYQRALGMSGREDVLLEVVGEDAGSANIKTVLCLPDRKIRLVPHDPL